MSALFVSIAGITQSNAASVVSISTISGVSIPVTGGTPSTLVTETNDFTGSITWSSSPLTFAPSTVYTATITLVAKPGKTFSGVTANFFTVAGATSVSNQANSGVVTAVFPKTAGIFHTVTFDSNGGSGTMAAQSADIPTGLSLNSYTRTGYSFSGWNTTSNGNGTSYADGATFSFATSITLYAQWTLLPPPNHTVTFDANGGSGSMSPQTTNASTALSTNSFTRTGYSFANWNTAANGSGTSYADGATYNFSTSLTLYAQWTLLPPPLQTVIFDSNGGSGSMASQTANSATPLAANTFTRDGYTFSGWNTAANGSGTSYADGAVYDFASSVTLYARWLQIPPTNQIVFFASNGGVGSMNEQVSSTSTSLTMNSFTRDGYRFEVWNTAADGSGTPYANGAIYDFSASITLYAQWSLIPPVDNTVTFVANGGAGSMVAQTANGVTALSLSTLTRDGYTFSGWNTAANGSGASYADGATYDFSASLTLYAQWTLLPPPFQTVIFNSNGGAGSMLDQTANTATALAANKFTRDGYTFSSWNTTANGSGVVYTDGTSYDFSISITLYAQWTLLPPPNHTVTFDANGGAGSMVAQTANSVTALSMSTFTRDGYTFSGWNTAANGSGTPYADGAIYDFASSVTLYAQWLQIPPKNFTVEFKANGGIGTMASQLGNSEMALSRNLFTRSGYTFSGWNTAADGSESSYTDGETYQFASSMTLYAQWSQISTGGGGGSNGGGGGAGDGGITGGGGGAIEPNPSPAPAPTQDETTAIKTTPVVDNPVALAETPKSEESKPITLTDSLDIPFTVESDLIIEINLAGLNGELIPMKVMVPAGVIGTTGHITLRAISNAEENSNGLIEIKVNLYDSADIEVKLLKLPIQIELQKTKERLVPVWSEDKKAWQLIDPTFDGKKFLSDSINKGYYVDENGNLVILAKELSTFGLKKMQTTILFINSTQKTYVKSLSTIVNAIGGNGTGSLQFSSLTEKNCSVTDQGVVNFNLAGSCQISVIKGGDDIYMPQQSAVLQLTVKNYEFNVVGTKLAKQVSIILGKAFANKNATLQYAIQGSANYRYLTSFKLTGVGGAAIRCNIPAGSTLRLMIAGKAVAKKLVAA